MALSVERAEGGYALLLDGARAGFCDVTEEGGEAVFPHVEVDPAHEGKGFGSRLVREALADVRARGLTVRARCPFVVAYLERHPDEA